MIYKLYLCYKLVENIKREGFCAVSSGFCVGLVSNAHDLNGMLILEFQLIGCQKIAMFLSKAKNCPQSPLLMMPKIWFMVCFYS